MPIDEYYVQNFILITFSKNVLPEIKRRSCLKNINKHDVNLTVVLGTEKFFLSQFQFLLVGLSENTGFYDCIKKN